MSILAIGTNRGNLKTDGAYDVMDHDVRCCIFYAIRNCSGFTSSRSRASESRKRAVLVFIFICIDPVGYLSDNPSFTALQWKVSDLSRGGLWWRRQKIWECKYWHYILPVIYSFKEVIMKITIEDHSTIGGMVCLCLIEQNPGIGNFLPVGLKWDLPIRRRNSLTVS